MPVVETYSEISVSQTTEIPVPSPVGMRREEELLVVVVDFCQPCIIQQTSSDPVYLVTGPKHLLKMYFPFSDVKQTSNESKYREVMKIDLTDEDVSEDLQEEMFDKLFPVIYAAETYEVPILVTIRDITFFWLDDSDDDDDDEDSSVAPAAESAIEGLEKMRLDADIIEQTPLCGICQKDFALEEEEQEVMLTRMPCSHCYHEDCIARWLSVNHRCPLCRYPMPAAETPQRELNCFDLD